MAHTQRGFTLIEVLAVLGILAALASIALPVAEVQHRRLREEQLRTALREIRSALDAYKRASDEGRVMHRADESGYPPSLVVLVTGVEDQRSATRARLYFLRRIPRDPFSSDILPAEDTWATRSYSSTPSDPKPGRDVFDVASRSIQTGINGVPYQQW